MAAHLLSRLVSNRGTVFIRLKQVLLAVFFLVAAWLTTLAVAYRPTIYWLTLLVLLTGVFILIKGEITRVGTTHHFRIFPPGHGTLGRRKSRDNERMASLWELCTWRSHRWPGSIQYGRLLPEHRYFGWPRNLLIAGPPNDPRHVITVAGAQSGKGRAMLVPNLLMYQGSAMVVDPKGQLAAITANARGSGSPRITRCLGQDVYIIDPENIVKDHPVKAAFNPLLDIDEADSQAVRHAKIISECLISQPSGTDATGEFFVKQARALLEATILHVATFEPSDLRHLVHVRKLLTQGDADGLALIQDEYARAGQPCPISTPIDALIYLMTLNPAFHGEIQGVANRLRAADPKQLTDILGELANGISFIGTPGIRETLDGSSGPMLHLRQLRARPTTVYICMSNTALQRQERNLVRMLVELAAVTLEREPRKTGDWPVLIAMDEFYSLGYLKTVDIGFGAFPGYGILLWPVVQSISQLKEHYPKTWENFMACCRAQQYFGQLDPETHQYLSYRLAGLYSPVELASNVFSRDGRRQLVTFADRPASLLELVYYDEIFSPACYDRDPYL
jgi:hypothetical protein